jgi:Bacterial Ig-like domain (group 1)/PKD domain
VPLLAPTQSTITLTSSTTRAPLNSEVELIATVQEQSGSPVHDGTLVTFSTSLGTLAPSEVQTTRGTARTKLQTGSQSGIATVNATSGSARTTGGTTAPTTPGGTPTTTSGTGIQIQIGAAAANSVVLTANPSTVAPGGGTVTVLASVLDDAGNRLTGVPVTFSTTTGTLTSTVADTDANGVATTQLNTNQQATVTASAGSKTGTITVGVRTALSFTLATSPANPTVAQPVSLTITPSNNTASDVTVDWGDKSQQNVGSVAAARTVTHTYALAGFYTITATGRSNDGDTFSNSASVTVSPQPPVSLTVNPTSGPVSTNFAFTVTPTLGALITNVTINYGDGSVDDLGAISTQTTRNHNFSAPGTYTVTVTQSETSGNVTRASVTVAVSP